VEQLTLLFSPEGTCLLPDGEEFLAALGDPNPDYDAVGFAVRNLGFIKFQVLDRLVTEIELHPRNVDRGCLLAVERQLRKPGTKLFRIKYLESGWRSEISASAEHTIARLHELCAPAAEPSSTARFQVEPQDPTALMRDAGNPLRLLTQKWRTSFGNFDSSVIDLAFSSNLLPLLAITGFDKPDSDPVFRFIGEGHRWATRKYQITSIGEKVEDTPDKEFGHWAAEYHRAAAASGRPRYDLVTAGLQIAQEAGKPQRTLVYERLLLPWRGLAGEVLITSCAKKLGTERSANLPPGAPDNSVAR
jgi:hypothetical protein